MTAHKISIFGDDNTERIPKPKDAGRVARAQGCLLGQLAGDALGGLVEFRTAGDILREYPKGVRELADGGTWNTIAGQPTDDSEMALALARSIVEHGAPDAERARKAYLAWLNSHPFDCGSTVANGLRGRSNPESQANGAMMRISPLGIYGAGRDSARVAEWARTDAALTHPHRVCQEANALYAMAIAEAVETGRGGMDLYGQIVIWAREARVDESLMDVILGAAEAPPSDFVEKQGWVLIAFRNALWRLARAESLEEAVVDTVMRGGDTDTNAAICGALLGAVQGRDAVPKQWVEAILECRPSPNNPKARRPRPEIYWPVDAPELAEQLLTPPPPSKDVS